MRPFEEYFIRHQIKNVPLVKHVDNGCMLFYLGDVDKNQFCLCTYFWQDNTIHPGRYYVHFQIPVKNGYEKHRLFETHSEMNIKWHEYEAYWINWMQNNTEFTPIDNYEQAYLAAWSCFVYIIENFCNNLKPNWKNLFLESANLKNPVRSRIRYSEDCQKILEDSFPKISYLWKTRFYKYFENYSDWIYHLYNFYENNH
jgi:hypothetical protein